MTISPVLQSENLLRPTPTDLESAFQLPPLATWDPVAVPVALTEVTLVMPLEGIQVVRNGHGEPSDLAGLTESVREHGVLEPLIVTPSGRLLAGRRRLEAARRVGLAMVPVRVCAIADERSAVEVSLVENIERNDPDPLTLAQSYRTLGELGATVEEIARLVGQGTSHVYQHLALLDLHPEVQVALHTRTLSFADARAFTPLELEDQAAVFKEIRQAPKRLSSRQVKGRVDTRRILRLAQNAGLSVPESATPQGNYAALFEADQGTVGITKTDTNADPLAEINSLIAVMVAAAQGEDQVRAWARQLSQILERLRKMATENGATPKPSAVQERLF